MHIMQIYFRVTYNVIYKEGAVTGRDEGERHPRWFDLRGTDTLRRLCFP